MILRISYSLKSKYYSTTKGFYIISNFPKYLVRSLWSSVGANPLPKHYSGTMVCCKLLEFACSQILVHPIRALVFIDTEGYNGISFL